MRMLSAAELLAVWEGGLELRPFEQALLFLEAAFPESSRDTLARLSIGDRDNMLLKVRESVFGSGMSVLARCPRCKQQIESMVQGAELRSGHAREAMNESCIVVGNYRVQFRPPNSEDIAACANSGSGASEYHLLLRCVVDASRDGITISPDQLPEEAVGTLADHLARLDPQADLDMDLSCPACAFRWTEPFDIVSFFWMETDAWARRLLRDVHVLASAYGWKEQDILALSPLRRKFYLDLSNA